MAEAQEYQNKVEGYKMIRTNTMQRMKYCRLIVLIKEEYFNQTPQTYHPPHPEPTYTLL